ncbi:MAG TPA: DUF167 domain-containing protein [Candidatus Limnocylindrales bacterium]|nr:DUF167 domain-containing protein [Candidatus Limnocylindrales bacterium]
MLSVRLTPRAGRDTLDGPRADGDLAARVSSPPVDDAANEALCRLVARQLGLPRGAVTIASGGRSRRKRLQLAGITADAVAARWPGVRVVDASARAAG